MKKTMKLMAVVIAFFGVENNITAQDRLFTYTYQSGVLNSGQREIEVWNTFRTGRTDYFARLDNRTEFEIGLGKNLQTAFYLNLTSKTNTVDILGVKSFTTGNELSFSNEWKYKILDPLADKMLTLAAFLGLMMSGAASAWAIYIIIVRELFITGLRTLSVSEGIDVSASMAGKIKTVVQMIAIGFLLMHWPFATALLWVAVALTIYSGIEYLIGFSKAYKGKI